jgi:hypothetical protein
MRKRKMVRNSDQVKRMDPMREPQRRKETMRNMAIKSHQD